MKYKNSIFIGKFSPFNLGHKKIIDYALSISEKVIVVIGSANTARTIKNCWTTKERKNMISSCFSKEDQERIIFVPIQDKLYTNLPWMSSLLEKINKIIDKNEKTTLVSFEDDKSAYLKSFPQYETVKFDFDNKKHYSDDIRYRYFTYDLSYKFYVPENIGKFLEEFQKTEHFKSLKEEFDYIKKYRASWDNTPFPPSFNCVDAVILRSSSVLVIRRGRNPGKGLLALPGGFIDPNETILDAALREVREETSINFDLKNSISDVRTFDDPNRSSRGRTFSHAHFFDLGNGSLPHIKAGDDASSAEWMPMNEIFSKEEEFFEDHWHIIQYFILRHINN